MKNALIVSDHNLDPRLRLKLSLLKKDYGEVFVVEDFDRAPYFKNNSKRSDYRNIPYDELNLDVIKSNNIGLIYVSGAKVLVDKFLVFSKVKKDIPIIIEIPDLPLRKKSALFNFFVAKIFSGVVSYLSSGIVITSDAFLHPLKYKKPFLLFYNYPSSNICEKLLAINCAADMHHRKVITYYGAIRYLDQIELLLTYGKNHPEVDVKIYGGPLDELEKIPFFDAYRDLANIEFLGPYDYENDIVSILSEASVVYSVYDAAQVNVRLALPNKLYEAVLAARPIVVSESTYLSEVVRRSKLGVEVPFVKEHYDLFDEKMTSLINNLHISKLEERENYHRQSELQKDNFIDFVKRIGTK